MVLHPVIASRGGVRLLGGVMIAVFFKYPHLLDEAPGRGDLKTAPPRQGDYVSYTLLVQVSEDHPSRLVYKKCYDHDDSDCMFNV